MKHSQRDPRFSGYNLFTEEFFKQHVRKQKAKGKVNGKKAIGADQRTHYVLSLQMRESWKRLSSTEKGEYTKRAQQLRAPGKVDKYIVPFLTTKNFRDSCGVHVVSWLQMWDGKEQEDGYTIPYYSKDEIREMKIGLLWWLANHQKNTQRHKVLSMIEDSQKRKMSR